MMKRWTFSTRVLETDGVVSHPTSIVVFAEDYDYARTRGNLLAACVRGDGLSIISVEETAPAPVATEYWGDRP